ncbi:hypothetical protein RJ641_018233, partial [Dillenia turbinata]
VEKGLQILGKWAIFVGEILNPAATSHQPPQNGFWNLKDRVSCISNSKQNITGERKRREMCPREENELDMEREKAMMHSEEAVERENKYSRNGKCRQRLLGLRNVNVMKREQERKPTSSSCALRKKSPPKVSRIWLGLLDLRLTMQCTSCGHAADRGLTLPAHECLCLGEYIRPRFRVKCPSCSNGILVQRECYSEYSVLSEATFMGYHASKMDTGSILHFKDPLRN